MDSAVEEALPLAFIKKMFSCGLAEVLLADNGEINSLFKNSDTRSFFPPTF